MPFPKLRLALSPLLAGLAMVILDVLFLRHALDGTTSFSLFSDNEYFLGPVLATMSHTFSEGEWPLRLGEFLGGMPVYNFAQFSSYYPFYFWALPVYDNPLETMLTMHWVTLMHIVILQFNSYILLRRISVSRFSSVVGATLIAYSANSLGYADWVSVVAPYAWLPLYLAGLIGLLKGDHRGRDFFIGLGGIVLLTLASPAQPLIHAVFLSLVFCVAFFVSNIADKDGRQRVIKSAIWLACMAGAAMLLTAPALIPPLVEFEGMIRWVSTGAVLGNQPLPFDAFLYDQMEIRELAGVIFPIKTVSVGDQFVGVITLGLALMALVSRKRNWVVYAFCFVAVYSLVSATGDNMGFAQLNYQLPLINKIREPSRFLVLFQLAVGVLAAVGIDALREKILNRRTKDMVSMTILMVILLLLMAASYLVIKGQIISNISPVIWFTVFIVLLVASCIASLLNHNRINKIIHYAWGCAALMSLGLEVQWAPHSISVSSYMTDKMFELNEVFGEIEKLDSERNYRVVTGPGVHIQYASMLSSYHRLRSLSPYINPMPHEQFLEMYYHGQVPINYHQAIGVRYLICKKDCDGSPPRGAKKVVEKFDYSVYQYESALPKFYLTNTINGHYSGLGQYKNKIMEMNLDDLPLLIETQEYEGIKSRMAGAVADNCGLAAKSYKNNLMHFQVDCNASSALVVNEYFDGNWSVEIDGQSARIYEVNGNQLGVVVPANSSDVVFQYRPPIVRTSLYLALFGFVLIFGAFCIRGLLVKRKTELLSLS